MTSEATEQAGPIRERTELLAERSVRPTGSGRSDVKQFLSGLLEMQCRIAGASAGVFYITPTQSREGGLIARYAAPAREHAPDGESLLTGATLEKLEQLGTRATAEAMSPRSNGRASPGIVETISGADGSGLYAAGPSIAALACPIVADGRVEGASVLLTVGRPSDADSLLRVLALTSARFESFLWRQQCLTESEQKTRLRETLELLDAALETPSAKSMGAVLCHELRRRFACSRVSIGLIRGGRLRLEAVSGADTLDRKGAAVEAIEDAMEECAEQDSEIFYPPPASAEQDPGQRRIVRAHESLSSRFGPSAMVSLPLRVEGDLVGVALLEREPSDPFPILSAPLFRLVAEFIGPAMWTRRLADRGVLAVSRDRALALGEAIVGPRHTGKKLLGLLVIVVLAGLAFVPIPARVPADAEARAEVARTIIPPFNGILQEVHVRPGDEVQQGQVLAEMETADLTLKLAQIEASLAELLTQQADARSQGRFEQVEQLDAQIDEANASRDLAQHQLARATIAAPFDGTIARGDLEALAGARVDPTSPLMEIVGEGRRVVLRVDERDISRVRKGQEGWFAPRSRPGERIPIVVTRINPAAEAAQGSNVYLVEAAPENPDADLDPGMTGLARLQSGWTTGLQRILGPTIDELRLRLWW